MRVFVIIETSASIYFERLFDQPIGVVTSLEAGEALIARRHPSLNVEKREEKEDGLDIELRGVGLDQDGTDLSYWLEIRPFEIDPTNVEVLPLPKQFQHGRET